MDYQDLKELLEKYKNDGLNSEEKELLLSLLDDNQINATANALTVIWRKDPSMATSESFALIKERMEAVLAIDVPDEKFTASLEKDLKKKSSLLTFSFFWKIAASVIVLMSIAAYMFFKNELINDREASKHPSLTQTIYPGKQGGTLLLHGGKMVVLDSLKNTVIALENGSEVHVKNGQLEYKYTEKLIGDTSYNTILTPKGRQFHLVLPDGTMVWLNAASSIRFPVNFAHSNRTVELSGEAYFEVKEDAKRPFKLTFNNRELLVLGTSFNVNAYDDEVNQTATLISGSVKVVADEHSYLIKPAQQIELYQNPANNKLLKLSQGKIDQILAWKNGAFNFNEKSLEEVMRQVARWYNVEVTYEGDVPQFEFIGEMGRDLNLEQCLKVLERMNVKFELVGRTIIVKGRKA